MSEKFINFVEEKRLLAVALKRFWQRTDNKYRTSPKQNMGYSIDDLKANILAKSSSPEKIEKVVVYILEDAGKTSYNNTMSTDEIIKAYNKLKEENEDIIIIPDNSIASTISVLSRKADSRIQCPGKKQGYFVSPITENNEENENEVGEIEQTDKGKLLEKDLYPLLKKWMELFLSVKSIDISARRGSLKWRNPDLLGIKEIDFLGDEKFEILTIEVKPNIQDWTMYIFEAVSHSLFSNRTYFAYLKDTFYEKVPDEMKLYASLRDITRENTYSPNLCHPDLLPSALSAEDFAKVNIGEIAADDKNRATAID